MQTGLVFTLDVATGKQVGKHNSPLPMYGGVMVSPDLVWAGALDGTVSGYDGKTQDVT